MKIKSIVFLTLIIFNQIHVAASEKDFSDKMKKILASSGSKVSLSLRDASGTELTNVNGSKALAPASIAKTVSTSCSLEVLGPQFQYETLFGYTGKIEGDALKGDLIIRGSGDPSLVSEDIHEVVEKLRYLHGIKKITGNLVFDASYLGVKSLSMADGFEGDEGRSFTVDITPTTFNQNSFSVWVAPDARDSKKTRAVTMPANVLDVDISNKSKIANSTEVSVSYSPSKSAATVGGTMDKDAEPKGIYRAVDDPYDYAFKILHRFWLDAGGEWSGAQIKVSNTSVPLNLLWKQSSRPLSKIMMDVNKFSLNLGAEMIFLAAGAEKFGRPATYEKSLKLLKECLAKNEIPEDGIYLTNGSGLSREALIKTSALTQFLQKTESSRFAPEYQSTFGILGIDGTSKSRLKNFAGRARLKTGSLKNVRSIAGFLYGKDNKVYTFSMIQNSVNPNDAKRIEDQAIETFFKEF